MKYLSKHTFLIAIFLLATVLRFYQIDLVPPSPSLDEVSIGYNAYSLLKTGEDEYGTKFPLLLRAYDDFRPAFYVYLVMPFVALLNLSVVAVRLPSVILSVLTVVGCYFLVKELLKTEKNSKGEAIALLTTLLLTISPWHIYISRLGHEVNAGFAFFIFGLLFFLREKIALSAFLLCLSFVSYQTEKVFLPLFIVLLIFFYWKRIWSQRKIVFFTTLAAIAFLIPFLQQSLSDEGLVRFKGTNIFAANEDIFYKRSIELATAKQNGDIVGQIIHNRRMVAGELVLGGYLSHFNPVWLFANFGEEKHKVPNMGLLYMWEAPFLLFGMFALLSFRSRLKYFILGWVLIAPVASSITTDAPHAMRSLVFLPTFQLITALGLYKMYDYIKSDLAKNIAQTIFIIVVIVSVTQLYKNYFVLFPKQQSSSFQLALSQAIVFVEERKNSYDKIIFSNQNNLYQSYMFYLYNTSYDPKKYQDQGGTVSGGYDETHGINTVEFRPIDWKNESGNNLYIGNVSDFPKDSAFLAEFGDRPDKKVVILEKKK